jgi:NAD(P)-dependent dehydrogenase (short-subunit alcohol dehydrogenase family)
MPKQISRSSCSRAAPSGSLSLKPSKICMAEETVAKFRRINILVNNAAILHGLQHTPSEDIAPQLWDKMMAVNVKGIWLCARAVAPQMKKQRKGKIINISSIRAFMGRAGMTHYTVTRGAVISMTYTMAAELGEYNICVNTVAPGYVITEASLLLHSLEEYEKTAQTRQDIKHVLYPEDLAGAIAFLVSDDADAITGQTIVVDGNIIKH